MDIRNCVEASDMCLAVLGYSWKEAMLQKPAECMPDFKCLARNGILISRNEGRGENNEGVISIIILLLHNARKSLLLKRSLVDWVLKWRTALTLYPLALLSLQTPLLHRTVPCTKTPQEYGLT